MKFELFIALRYLRAKRRQTFISIISIFSMVGVALGVASLIVAMGIMNGFTRELREKIMGATAQIVVYNAHEGMRDYERIRSLLLNVPGVENVTPFLYTELAISTPGGVKGLMTRGIDPAGGPLSINMLNNLVSGSLSNLSRQAREEDSSAEAPPDGIIIGQELASSLRVGLGSRVNLLAPSGRRSSAGVAPRVAPFVIAGTFSTGMLQFDTSLGFVSLEAARSLMGIRDELVSGLELSIADPFKADSVAEELNRLLGGRYTIRTWMESNINVFAALRLEKLAMGIVLFLIVLVASFSIVASLIMLVMEKTRDIAVLMSMGARKESIRKIFRLQGLIIGLLGTAVGFGAGYLLCFLLRRYKFIKLPEGAYPMNYVPVLLQWQDLLSIALGAVLICYLATLYPAGQAARLVPAEALRSE
ncbi:MAG: ABC transporter permease [Deltaproteobacteria bacterium]|jgi:lipoprotein-releasing system permease protein|nr:ABC transporter permease [Deltaproteobacteria bacterium]